jgi:anaerobic ribonucleoside-triphosphate reductase activating protein
VWSGYTLEELKSMNDSSIDYILSAIDYLIDGRYEDDKKDLKLKMRGSSNQNVYQRINNKLKKIDI